MNIGVIGYGHMGSMIVENILKLELLFDDENLIISNRHIEKIQDLEEEYGDLAVEITDDNAELASKCEKIIISVETPQFKELLKEIKPFLKDGCHLMYTCSGLEFENVEKIYDGKLSMIIPTYASTASSSNSIASQNRRKGITLMKHNSKVEFEEQKYIEDLFNEFSYVKKFDDFHLNLENPFNYTLDLNTYSMKNDMEVSTAITSCAPAFIAILIEKLAVIASMHSGMPKKEIEQMITKTVLATASLKDDYNLSNEEIISQVATKGGITQEGVDFLYQSMDKIYEKLIYNTIKRFDEVKKELDEEYSKED